MPSSLTVTDIDCIVSGHRSMSFRHYSAAKYFTFGAQCNRLIMLAPEPRSDISDTLPDTPGHPRTFRTGISGHDWTALPDTFRTGPDTFRTGPRVDMSSFKSDTPDTPDTAIGQSDDSSRIFCRMPFWSEVKLTIQSKGTLLMKMMYPPDSISDSTGHVNAWSCPE